MTQKTVRLSQCQSCGRLVPLNHRERDVQRGRLILHAVLERFACHLVDASVHTLDICPGSARAVRMFVHVRAAA